MSAYSLTNAEIKTVLLFMTVTHTVDLQHLINSIRQIISTLQLSRIPESDPFTVLHQFTQLYLHHISFFNDKFMQISRQLHSSIKADYDKVSFIRLSTLVLNEALLKLTWK